MRFMKRPNDFLFRALVILASVSLAVLSLLVIYSVVMRYVFSDAPDFVEPIALLLVIVIAMFGAALKVREGGHIAVAGLLFHATYLAGVFEAIVPFLILVACALLVAQPAASRVVERHGHHGARLRNVSHLAVGTTFADLRGGYRE